VLRLERPAVHLVGEEDLRAAGVDDREAALVVLLNVALEAVVEAGEHHLERVVLESRHLEQRRQRRARPLGGPDGLEQPGLAHRTRMQPGATVAGALEGDAERLSRQVAKVIEGQLERLPNAAADVEAPRQRVDCRDVEMGQEVVEPRRGHVVAQGFEGHPAIPRRKLELFEGQRTVRRLEARGGRRNRHLGAHATIMPRRPSAKSSRGGRVREGP